ncbi:PepSY domain-containing protein [Aequorivita echinoideorum]|uniref:NADPH--hemoprotein reductase n=1 Tax=Aequorivita echinoideorum TaxID=1549647 RepID=A0ABS5S0G7_9FLAO|nr:PepSY domain-containing protein [Aequorivita echinoideorum]MBT0606711.1 PepSY domain-containing protein [Aequorivita echinoideorum]
MTLSLWRYSHLALAVVSSLFLLVASVTAVILAVEPIAHQTKGFAVENLDEVSLAESITGLKKNYDEVFSLEVELSGFVKASVLTEDFETKDIYINPKTGEKLGEVAKRPEIYSFATNLHRSLFLKSIGRFFVGLVSLLLFLIAITGIFLLAKRQGGIKKIFSKVQKEYFEMRYHVILSRIFFIPIVIVALTGVYLSAEKFELLPNTSAEFQENIASEETQFFENLSEIPFFNETKLSEIKKVDFPFSEDAEDYFHIALNDREIKLNQQTGAIVSRAEYPFVAIASRFSLILHTGEGSVLWSIILLIASASIIFFMYSGFVMTLKRRKKVVANSVMPNKDECEFVILVGSETGTTFDFATRLYNALTHSGKQVFMTEPNNYSVYAEAKHILFLTATYGEGEAPTNARKFEPLFKTINQPNKINYSVVGFGSLEYPNYCEFAIKIQSLLQSKTGFESVLPLYKIDNADFTDFQKWAKKYSEKLAIPLKIETPKPTKKPKLISFEVLKRTELNVDDTFLIQLKPKRKRKFTSGDLLSVFPDASGIARQYSIAKMDDSILLSIKKHEFGKGSNFLFGLQAGDSLKAAIETNPDFHFPKKTDSAILIANGTGIAPFLGMVHERKNAHIQLLWGGRTQNSSAIYDSYLMFEDFRNKNLHVQKCFSREASKKYVQDLVAQSGNKILNTVKNNGCIMICGSLSMQHGVLEVLEEILKKNPSLSLDVLMQKGQLKMDCY